VDTVCVDGACPCDPPASPPKCQKCVDGELTGFCQESDCCTDGRCLPCPPPYCPTEPCEGEDCCVDGQCLPCPEYECPVAPCGEDECCVDGYCIPCPDYGCTGEEECEEGECCIDGECVPCDPCSPGDCGEGQCCVDGQCYPCPPPPDDPCSPGSCPPGECCVNGYCLPCPPEECPDTPCPSGECCIDGYCINPCPPGQYCCDGECQEEPCEEECEGSCDGDNPCPEGCECCTVWSGGSPGSLGNACRNVSDDYACCCDTYQFLCREDFVTYIPGAHSGAFPPDIPGSPPANAILLINSSAVYCDVSRDIEGSWQYDESDNEAARYEYSYFYPVADCDDCTGACTDWFDTAVFVPQFWQIFCDCATENSVDVCGENPLP
jgi:hypothetical protein